MRRGDFRIAIDKGIQRQEVKIINVIFKTREIVRKSWKNHCNHLKWNDCNHSKLKSFLNQESQKRKFKKEKIKKEKSRKLTCNKIEWDE